MKCHIMWHFIWVFTVCHSKGVSGLQRVKTDGLEKHSQFYIQKICSSWPMMLDIIFFFFFFFACVETEGLRLLASPESLHCVLEQDTLICA